MRRWRRLEGGGEIYRKEKGEYKILCEEKRRKEVERWDRRG